MVFNFKNFITEKDTLPQILSKFCLLLFTPLFVSLSAAALESSFLSVFKWCGQKHSVCANHWKARVPTNPTVSSPTFYQTWHWATACSSPKSQ